MTKRELIEALKALDCDDDTPVGWTKGKVIYRLDNTPTLQFMKPGTVGTKQSKLILTVILGTIR